MKRHHTLPAGVFAFLLPLQAAPIELKLGHVGEPTSLFALCAQEFAKRVESQSGGRVRVLVFGSSQLGGDKEMLQKLKLGTLDFSLPSSILSSEIPLFGLFEMPYLVRDRKHMAGIEKEIFWPVLAPEAEKRGYRLLAVWENGFRHITNRRRPIRVPADLQGIKLRVPMGKWRVRMFQSYGAGPSPMAFSEVFVALQSGVMDGQENPLAQIYSARFHEVQKYLSLSEHVYTPAFLAVGRRRWETLPADVRKLLQATARELQEFVLATALRLEAQYLQAIQTGGIQVNEIDRAAFERASRAIYREFESEVPEARQLLDKVLRIGAAQ